MSSRNCLSRVTVALVAALCAQSNAPVAPGGTFTWNTPTGGAFFDVTNYTISGGDAAPVASPNGDRIAFGQPTAGYFVTLDADANTNRLSITNGSVGLSSDSTTLRTWTINTGTANPSMFVNGGAATVGSMAAPLRLMLSDIVEVGSSATGTLNVVGVGSMLKANDGGSLIGAGGFVGRVTVGHGAAFDSVGIVNVGVSNNAATHGYLTVADGTFVAQTLNVATTAGSNAQGDVVLQNGGATTLSDDLTIGAISGTGGGFVHVVGGSALTLTDNGGAKLNELSVRARGSFLLDDGSVFVEENTRVTGTMQLTAGRYSTGLFEVNAGGTAMIEQPVALTVSSSSGIQVNAGGMLVINGTRTVGVPVAITGAGAHADLSTGASFALASTGTLNISGGATVATGNVLSLAAGSAVTVTGNDSRLILPQTLTGLGTVNVVANARAAVDGDLTISDGAHLTFNTGALLDLDEQYGSIIVDGAGTSLTFVDSALALNDDMERFEVRNGASVTSVGPFNVFQFTPFFVSSGAHFTGGSYHATQAALYIDAATVAFTDAVLSTMSCDGNDQLRMSNGSSLTFANDFRLRVLDGSAALGSGAVIGSDSSLTVSGNLFLVRNDPEPESVGSVLVDHSTITLANGGTATVQAGVLLDLRNAGAFANAAGTTTIQSDARVQLRGGHLTSATTNVDGRVQAFDLAPSMIDGDVNILNVGHIEAAGASTLNVNGTLANFNMVDGVSIAAGATVNATIYTGHGTTGPGTLAVSTFFDPGVDVGTIAIGGDLTMPNAIVRTQIDGATYDSVTVDGTLVLGGPLAIDRASSFTDPTLGTQFLLFDANARSGVFTLIDGLVIAADRSFAITYVDADVKATVALNGDADVNGIVNFDDLLALARHFQTTSVETWAHGDFNGDGAVEFDDLLMLARNFERSNALASAALPMWIDPTFAVDWALARAIVPEPSSAMFAGESIMLTMAARRRRCATTC